MYIYIAKQRTKSFVEIRSKTQKKQQNNNKETLLVAFFALNGVSLFVFFWETEQVKLSKRLVFVTRDRRRRRRLDRLIELALSFEHAGVEIGRINRRIRGRTGAVLFVAHVQRIVHIRVIVRVEIAARDKRSDDARGTDELVVGVGVLVIEQRIEHVGHVVGRRLVALANDEGLDARVATRARLAHAHFGEEELELSVEERDVFAAEYLGHEFALRMRPEHVRADVECGEH